MDDEQLPLLSQTRTAISRNRFGIGCVQLAF
jgi:hypothetical protein